MRAWSAPQRRVLILLCIGLIGYIAFRLIRDRAYVPNPQPAVGPRSGEVADRIDPNTSDVATLAALPTIGEKRAKDIIAFREDWLKDHPGAPVFRSPDDLLRIRGIGMATLEQISPYLMFPTTAPAPK